MNYTWKILSVKANDDGLITQAKYYVRVEENDMNVETEGTWFFKDLNLVISFKNVTEQDIIQWIKTESKELIETRLAQQLKNLAERNETPLPWAPQVFKLKL